MGAPALSEAIAAMGSVLTPALIDDTIALVAPGVRLPPADDCVQRHDLAYGPAPRHRLDLYRPLRLPAKRLPMVAFFPGGGFVGGDKNLDDVFYANIGRALAARGIVTLIATYRLAPQSPWPAGAEDVAELVSWVQAGLNEEGGDTQRIVLFGHSAGGCHVAGFLGDPALAPRARHAVKGAVLGSAFLEMNGETAQPWARAYFGDDAAQWATRSPLSSSERIEVPLLLFNAEFDPPMLAVPSYELAARICRASGRAPAFLTLTGHNHLSEILCFGTGDDRLLDAICDFVRRVDGEGSTA